MPILQQKWYDNSKAMSDDLKGLRYQEIGRVHPKRKVSDSEVDFFRTTEIIKCPISSRVVHSLRNGPI